MSVEMIHHIFCGFSTNSTLYAAARQFWSEQLREILAKYYNVANWKPWLNGESYAKLEEGNIFDLYSGTQNRGFIIQQYEPTANKIVIAARVDIFGEGFLENPVPYLWISCELSSESAQIVIELFKKWRCTETTLEEMQHYCIQMESSAGFRS